MLTMWFGESEANVREVFDKVSLICWLFWAIQRHIFMCNLHGRKIFFLFQNPKAVIRP